MNFSEIQLNLEVFASAAPAIRTEVSEKAANRSPEIVFVVLDLQDAIALDAAIVSLWLGRDFAVPATRDVPEI